MFLFFQKGLIIKILHILKYLYIQKIQIGMVAHIPTKSGNKRFIIIFETFYKK